MNKAQIIEMARAAGITFTPMVIEGVRYAYQHVNFDDSTFGDEAGCIERFAQLVADHALEAAAKVCEARAKEAPAPLAAECLLCAVAIRAMKGNP